MQMAQDLEAVHPRQTNIEHDQIEPRIRRFTQSSFTVMDDNRIMACLYQRRGNLPRQLHFIFNHKDAHEFESGEMPKSARSIALRAGGCHCGGRWFRVESYTGASTAYAK